MYNKNDYRNYLAHHGIIGMHWGVRRYQPYGNGGYNPGSFFERRRAHREISRYRNKYGLSDSQANYLFEDRKNNGYSKRYANRVAKNLRRSYGNLAEAKYRANRNDFLKKSAIAVASIAVLSNPTGRKMVMTGSKYVVKGSKKVISTSKIAAPKAYKAFRTGYSKGKKFRRDAQKAFSTGYSKGREFRRRFVR